MIYLRDVNTTDKDLLLRWANDPLVRTNSFNSDPISYDIHEKWFDSMMDDEDILQYILMDDGIPVGQIRLNVDNEEAEISYSIAREYRGCGYGHRILRLIKRVVEDRCPNLKRLIAKVKSSNDRSISLFESEGYVLDYKVYSINVGQKNINDQRETLMKSEFPDGLRGVLDK